MNLIDRYFLFRMPMWIRTVFLHYLPAMLLMKRPRKTRLRWMMEMPGMSVPPHPNPYGSPTELPKHISSINAKQAKMEVMELSDLHHPNCKINRKINCGGDLGGVTDSCRRESESSDSILLSPEASKATEAVEFIAEHLRNEDLYIQVDIFVCFCFNFWVGLSQMNWITDSWRLEIRSNGHR